MNIANYADDTTSYNCCKDNDLKIEKLEVKVNEILQWFNHNAMKTNTDKCDLLLTAGEKIFLMGETQYKIVKLKFAWGHD